MFNKKVATKPGSVSAEQMFSHYAKKFTDENPTYFTRTWKYYIPHGEIFTQAGKSYRNYKDFKDILAACNREIGKRLVEGYAYDLGNTVGDLFMARIQRPNTSQRLNMRQSLDLKKKREAEGTLDKDNWKVYYTDEEYVMLVWHKKNILNKRLYKFKTAGGITGKSFKSLISLANNKNPFLKARYPYLPCKTLEDK